MREYSKKTKKVLLPIFSFLLTGGLLCTVYAWSGLFPFGAKTLAWGDMKQQVIPLMLEFKDILEGKAGFLLNLQNAGGMSFWGVFFFFLSSPFTFLIIFVEKGDIYFLVNVLVLLKLSLSAVTASLFFQEEQPGADGKTHLFCCISYALCGYGLLYYQNIVWLDALYMFPVLMLGFRRVIYSRKGVLFTVSLVVILIINYYLSYMVFLALILASFLFIKNCVPKEMKGKTAGKIGLCAILSLLLSAPVWLPSLLQCLRSARTGQGIIETIQNGDFFTKIFTALPVLLCTAAVFAAPALAPFFPSTPKRRTLLQLFFLLSLPIFFEPVNKLWHTGSYQAFPVRYGYIPVFLSLWYIADILGELPFKTGRSAGKRKMTILPFVVALSLSVTGFLILSLKSNTIISYTHSLWFDGESFFYLFLFASFAALWIWLGIFLCRKGMLKKTILGWALLSVCLIQGGYHATLLIGSAANLPERETGILQVEDTLNDEGVYRVKQDSKFCDVNLLGAAGFFSINHYTSLTDEKFLHAVKKLGYSSYWMETSACCGTAISDILLSNKYLLTKDLKWERTGSGNLGYIVTAETLPMSLSEGNRFDLQNSLYQKILSNFGGKPAGDLFLQYAPKEYFQVKAKDSDGKTYLRIQSDSACIRYQIPIEEREILYFDAFSENTNRLWEPLNGSFQVLVNGKTIAESYPTQSCNGILKLGNFENETVYVEIKVKKEVESLSSFGVYGIKRERVDSLSKNLQNGAMHVENSRVFCTAETETSGQALFLTIPYSPGMNAAVNGKPVQLRVVLDCFLEIPLVLGKNEVELSYTPQGIKFGIALSAFGAWVCLLFFLYRNHPAGKAMALWNRVAQSLLTAVFFAVLFLLYAAPTVLWFGRYF